MTEAQIQEIYQIVFGDGHSDSFRKAEVKDLLFSGDYCFLRKPKDDWEENLSKYLTAENIDCRDFNINKDILKTSHL